MTKYFNKHCVFNKTFLAKIFSNNPCNYSKTKSVFYILKNKAASIQISGFGVLCDMLSRKQMIRMYTKRFATVGLRVHHVPEKDLVYFILTKKLEPFGQLPYM